MSASSPAEDAAVSPTDGGETPATAPSADPASPGSSTAPLAVCLLSIALALTSLALELAPLDGRWPERAALGLAMTATLTGLYAHRRGSAQTLVRATALFAITVAALVVGLRYLV